MKGTVRLLDCTLRDGGQGLEDLNKNGIKTDFFSRENRIDIVEYMKNSSIEIVELGCIEESDMDKQRFSIYQNIESLSKFKPQKKKEEQMFVGLFIGPDTDLEKIPEHTPDLVDGVRVILRYSQLQKSLDYCAALSKKGYKVFVQPMLTMRYSDDELRRVVEAANEMNAFALYFVDSFGYMDENDIERLYRFYDERLNSDISIGFHAHNNMQMAMGNVKAFLSHLENRNLIIDSCAIGMGQGAGNLQTELVVPYLNKEFNKNYDMNSVLEVCEILGKFRMGEMNTWGYSPVRVLPAIHKVAYKYAVALRLQYNKSLVEINDLLQKMPDEMRHRYTPENLQKLLTLKKDMV